MRILLERDQHIGSRYHGIAKVGVQVEFDPDRHVRPNEPPYPPQQITLAIVDRLGAHRSVEREDHGIDRQRGRELPQDLVAQEFVRPVFHASRREREGVGPLY